MTPAPDNLPTRERVAELIALSPNICIKVSENEWSGLGPVIRALCDAYLRLTQENEWRVYTLGDPIPDGEYVIQSQSYTGNYIARPILFAGLKVSRYLPRPIPPPPSENSTGGGKSES